MPNEFSFDIVSKIDWQEVDNAVNQAIKEISQRFDFKGSKSKIELSKEEKTITVTGDDDFKLKAVKDVLESKCVKRGISLKALDYGAMEPAFEGTVRQTAKVKEGIPHEQAKEIIGLIKESKLKVQSQIQGEQLRVSSRSKDDLQTVMQIVKEHNLNLPLQFTNYR